VCKLIFPDGEKMEHRELKPATRVREFTEEEGKMNIGHLGPNQFTAVFFFYNKRGIFLFLTK